MDNEVQFKQKYLVHEIIFSIFLIIIFFFFVFQDLSAGDRYDIGQTISFQLHDAYEQLIHFPAQIFLNSLNLLLASRLRLTQDRIRNVTLGKENGLLIAFFLISIYLSFHF